MKIASCVLTVALGVIVTGMVEITKIVVKFASFVPPMVFDPLANLPPLVNAQLLYKHFPKKKYTIGSQKKNNAVRRKRLCTQT